MKKSGKVLEHIVLIGCLYIISYQLILFFWGNQGIQVYRELLKIEEGLQQHYDQLKQHQRNLLVVAEKGESNPNITIQARGLGYYNPDDRLVLMNTWTQAHSAPSQGKQMEVQSNLKGSIQHRQLLLYALFLTSFLWLIVYLLHFGQNTREDHFEHSPRGLRASPYHQNPATNNTDIISQNHPKTQKQSHQNEDLTETIEAHNIGLTLETQPYFPQKPGEVNSELLRTHNRKNQ